MMKLLQTSLPTLLLLALAACSREVGAEHGSVLPPDTRLAAVQALVPPSEGPVAPPAAEAIEPLIVDPVLEPTAVPFATVLYSEHDAEVSTRIAGVVRSFAVELGDVVRAGQLLAVLHDEQEAAAVESARATLELARIEHSRAAHLGEQQMLSQAEVDRAAYLVRAAEAALKEAQVRLDYTRIRAPFAGVISRRFIRTAQTVEERAPLFRVTALHPLRAQLRISELEARGLRPGQELRLRSPGGEEVRGVIARIAPAVDPVSGTVEVLVNVPTPGGLRPGSSVAAAFEPVPPQR